MPAKTARKARARSADRMEFLSYVMSTGLSYSWFQVAEIDYDAVTAVIYTEGDDDDFDEPFTVRHEINADDIARGLRMFRENLEGKREGYEGEWAYNLKQNPEWTPSRARPDYYGWQLVLQDKTNGDDGDSDADTCDQVMQFAVLGQCMYG